MHLGRAEEPSQPPPLADTPSPDPQPSSHLCLPSEKLRLLPRPRRDTTSLCASSGQDLVEKTVRLPGGKEFRKSEGRWDCLSPRPPTSHQPELPGKGEILTATAHPRCAGREPDAPATSNHVNFSQQPVGLPDQESQMQRGPAALRRREGPRIRFLGTWKETSPVGTHRLPLKCPPGHCQPGFTAAAGNV